MIDCGLQDCLLPVFRKGNLFPTPAAILPGAMGKIAGNCRNDFRAISETGLQA